MKAVTQYRHYHPSSVAVLEDVQRYEAIAKKQDEAVMDFFKIHPNEQFSPFEVMDYLKRWNWIEPQVPITSIRRAMSNLVKAGKLIKCESGKLERLGRGNHVWRLAYRYEQAKLF